MEIVLLLAVIAGALLLSAPPPPPTPRSEIIVIQSRPEMPVDAGLGCLPLIICVVFILIVAGAM